jgi:arginine-tRNA-protein transferase
MHEQRGWPFNEITRDSYSESFLGGHWTFDRQMSFRRNGKLIGVSLIDVLDDVSSSIYFYHDPDWRPMSPGTFSMMCELKYLQNQGLKHHYLGYWVKECQSMEYKSRFAPHELLESYVDDATEPTWKLA